MAQATARTYTRRRHRETEWQRFKRIMKRHIGKFLRRNIFEVIALIILLMGMGAGAFIGVKATNYAQSNKINDYGRHQTYTAYTVKSGDTVWDIAADLAALNPEYNDIRQYVIEIERLNKIHGGDIKAGQKILIPYFIGPDGTVSHDEIYSKYGIGD